MRTQFFFCLLLLVVPSVQAQQYWRAANGPFGGTIVSRMTVTDEAFFASTVGGLFRSDDAGETWTLDMEGVTASGVDTRSMIQTADGSSLLATYGGGIFRRWPGAAQWQKTNTPDAWTRDLVQAGDGTLYAATIRGILRSDNGGSTWMALSVSDRSLNITSLAVLGTDLYAGTAEGVYKTTDRGVTWDWASIGMTTFDVDMLFTSSTGDLYAGTSPITGGCTLFRTTSAGRYWTCVQPQTDPIRAGGMAEDSQGRLYFGGYRFVYRSDDEGGSWQAVATTNTTVHGIAAVGSTVVAGTYGRGVIRSSNRGTSWTVANQGLHSAIRDIAVGPDQGLYAATLGGVYVSHDFGSSWELLDALDAPVRPSQSLAFDAQGRLLDGTLNGLFRLDRSKNEWDSLGPPGTPPVRDVVPGPNGELFVGYHEGVYHLRGQNWTSYPLIGPDQAPRDVIAVGIDSGGTLFAGGTYDSFMRPTGTTGWIRLTSMATPYFEAQVFAHDTQGRLYAGTRYFGVMRSSDNGQTWTPMTNGLSGSEDIRTIAFDASGELYIGSFGNGVYKLNARNNTWQPLNEGMESARRVTALAFDDTGNAFAGTYGSGIWVHAASTTLSTDTEQPRNIVDVSVFPNPATGPITAQTRVWESGPVVIEVFDLLGRRVVREQVFATAGSQTQTHVDLKDQPAGVYAVRVTTAGVTTSRTVSLVR